MMCILEYNAFNVHKWKCHITKLKCAWLKDVRQALNTIMCFPKGFNGETSTLKFGIFYDASKTWHMVYTSPI